ncbi:MAG: hypothetical protein KDD22_08725 [Bdellovibrionales bacterium]|nr:hypothetical protein [Bdellovibrionales bacterium]
MRTMATVALLSFLSANSVWARGYMDHLRWDQTIPSQCGDLDIEDFDDPKIEFITYSTEGAEDRGFTYEYPIARKEGRQLWEAIRTFQHGDQERPQFKNPDLYEDFKALTDNYESMGFDFHSEGEVLELLAILAMKSHLTADYFITGSVAYQDKTAGELDIVIGHSQTCKIMVVGEVKLNPRALGHAKSQLQRFKDFIRTHLHPQIFDIDPTRRLLSPL